MEMMCPKQEAVEKKKVTFVLPAETYAVQPAVKAVWPGLLHVFCSEGLLEEKQAKLKSKKQAVKLQLSKTSLQVKTSMQALQNTLSAVSRHCLHVPEAGWRKPKEVSVQHLQELVDKKLERLVFGKLKGGGGEGEEDNIGTNANNMYLKISKNIMKICAAFSRYVVFLEQTIFKS